MATYEELVKANALIKTTDVKGKEYAEVPQRVKAFRSLYPGGSISTEILSLEGGICVMKATVADENGSILGSGTAYEKEGSSYINKTSYIENCETSAVGRALGFAGFGIDTSIASAEEVMNAQYQQSLDTVDAKRGKLKNLLMKTESDPTLFLIWCSKEFKREVNAVDELNEFELDRAMAQVKRKEKKQ